MIMPIDAHLYAVSGRVVNCGLAGFALIPAFIDYHAHLDSPIVRCYQRLGDIWCLERITYHLD
ncbi:hypothetical protein D3C71_1990550 [compost metagenome]